MTNKLAQTDKKVTMDTWVTVPSTGKHSLVHYALYSDGNICTSTDGKTWGPTTPEQAAEARIYLSLSKRD